MITQKTAREIHNCYSEITASEKLLAEVEKGLAAQTPPDLRDSFGRIRNLQLGVPSSDTSTRLYDVHPKLALSVIRAHLATKQADLIQLNEIARLELDQAEAQEPATA